MKRFCVVAALLVAISSLAAATQMFPSILPARKGVIQSIWVEPSAPTASTPVSLHVSITDHLRVDKVTMNRLSHRFILNVYWTDPPAGTSGDPSLGQYSYSLGTLTHGQCAALVQTFYKGQLVDFRTMMFQVH
jgi:hypothetical protein